MKKNTLFVASCVAIAATAMTFAIRAELINVLGGQFHLSSEEIGFVSGTAFWGFTLSMILGGFIVDKVGMRNIIAFALAGHVLGITMTIYATGFWSLFFSTLSIGIANGFVEAAVNPLVASLYPENKTTKLNLLHVWFPAGIVIGGLVVHYFNALDWGWQLQMATIFIPAILYGILLLPLQFPKTERVSTGVSNADMLKELSKPLFIVMAFAMLLTASTELGTNQWIAVLLKNAVSSPIILLVFINGIMVVGRLMAGKVEHVFSTTGMLLFSAIFSTLGLLLFNYLEGDFVFVAAGIFAMGVCYFWPTMLAFVANYLPKTGAMGLSVMGGMGMLSVAIILPLMGHVYDANSVSLLPEGQTLESIKAVGVGTKEAQLFGIISLQAGKSTLLQVAAIPALLIVIFGILFVSRKKQYNG
jgi:MFS family permease